MRGSPLLRQHEFRMDTTSKLVPGQQFNSQVFKRIDGEDYRFGSKGRWQALFVFRGSHCPICKKYLISLQAHRGEFERLGIDIAAVSADTEAQTRKMIAATQPYFPMLYEMDVATMRRLGLYISEPRSAEETDHPFPEPALFVVNAAGLLQIVEVANAPFVRPDLELLVGGIGFIMKNDYPIRGTAQ